MWLKLMIIKALFIKIAYIGIVNQIEKSLQSVVIKVPVNNSKLWYFGKIKMTNKVQFPMSNKRENLKNSM